MQWFCKDLPEDETHNLAEETSYKYKYLPPLPSFQSGSTCHAGHAGHAEPHVFWGDGVWEISMEVCLQNWNQEHSQI